MFKYATGSREIPKLQNNQRSTLAKPSSVGLGQRNTNKADPFVSGNTVNRLRRLALALTEEEWHYCNGRVCMYMDPKPACVSLLQYSTMPYYSTLSNEGGTG